MFKSHYILGAEREKSYFKKYINVLTKYINAFSPN